MFYFSLRLCRSCVVVIGEGPSLKSKLVRISFVMSDFLVWFWGMGDGSRGCVGGISLTLTPIP